jgi:hypothetical protein
MQTNEKHSDKVLTKLDYASNGVGLVYSESLIVELDA